MADTRNDIYIPSNTWVNLYSASGISVGTAVTVYNKGSGSLNLTLKGSQPTSTTGGYPVAVFPSILSFASVPAASSGLWAYSSSSQGTIVLVLD